MSEPTKRDYVSEILENSDLTRYTARELRDAKSQVDKKLKEYEKGRKKPDELYFKLYELPDKIADVKKAKEYEFAKSRGWTKD
jgi:hypothetical protein